VRDARRDEHAAGDREGCETRSEGHALRTAEPRAVFPRSPTIAGVARQIALLRGINLGSRNRVSMAELRTLVEGLGYEDVRTLLQSGNVVYGSTDGAATAARRIEEAVGRELGVDATVIVRTRSEIARVLEHDPLGKHASDPKRYLVVFLARKPSAKALGGLDPADYEPERFAAHGREVYLWLPAGVHKANLTHATVEKRLGIAGTARNWNTVEKLLALADG
jgi:uncharacterized protein (DUF1697 family)